MTKTLILERQEKRNNAFWVGKAKKLPIGSTSSKGIVCYAAAQHQKQEERMASREERPHKQKYVEYSSFCVSCNLQLGIIFSSLLESTVVTPSPIFRLLAFSFSHSVSHCFNRNTCIYLNMVLKKKLNCFQR